jgi:hypothetical protein
VAGRIMSEPQRNLTVDALEVVEGRDHEKIEGWIPELATEAELRWDRNSPQARGGYNPSDRIFPGRCLPHRKNRLV